MYIYIHLKGRRENNWKEIKMFPRSFLLHSGVFNLNINGVKIEARVVENSKEMEESYIKNLFSGLDETYPIVGFDLKKTSSSAVLLVLYVHGYCLLVKLRTGVKSSASLLKFLRDEDICFLGWDSEKVTEKVGAVRRFFGHGELETCVSVGNLAVRLMRNKECSSLEELASIVGVTFPPAAESSQITENYVLDGDEIFYTDEEIKFAVDEAYKCYTIGTQLLQNNRKR